MKSKKKKANLREERAIKALKPEMEDGVKLTDEELEQITGGVVPPIPVEDYSKMAGSSEHLLGTSAEENHLQGNERLNYPV